MLAAVQSNSVDKVRRFKERGIGWSKRLQPKLLRTAVWQNSLDVLKYLCEQRCKWPCGACALAVHMGHRAALEAASSRTSS